MKRAAFACMFALLFAEATRGADAGRQGVAVSDQPQLFLDDHVVAKLGNLKRKLIQPEKHPGNPLIVPDRLWERRYIQTYGTVLFDPAAGKFRAWYLASDDPKAKPEYYICYAESDDGIRWRKPPVGRDKLHGKYDKHNQVIAGGHGFCVMPTPDDGDPTRKYKGLGGNILGHSADGLAWTIEKFRAVGKNDTSSSVVRWRGRYYAYVRNQERRDGWPRIIRAVAVSSSPDFKTWTKKRTVLTPDVRDGAPWRQFYGMAVTAYGDQLIGLLWILDLDPLRGDPKRTGLVGPMRVQLAVSRDGETWHRVTDRATFLDVTPGAWDAGQVKPSTTMFVRDGKVWIYYTGFDSEHGPILRQRHGHSRRDYRRGSGGLGLAALPEDRFVGLVRRDRTREGVLETKPLTFSGRDLILNAEVPLKPQMQGTNLRVEVLDKDGNALPGFSRTESHLVRHDALRYRVVWRTRGDAKPKMLKAVTQRPLTFRFILRRAELYAFQIVK